MFLFLRHCIGVHGTVPGSRLPVIGITGAFRIIRARDATCSSPLGDMELSGDNIAKMMDYITLLESAPSRNKEIE